MSLILGIDTSSTTLGLALFTDDKPVLSINRFVENSHAEYITSAVRFLFESSGFSISMLTHVAVVVGPGSFTGLRIGVSFVKGLLIDQSVPVLSLSTLEILANTVLNRTGKVWAAIDARQGNLFVAEFEIVNKKVIRRSADRIVTIYDFARMISDTDVVVADNLGNNRSSCFSVFENNINFVSIQKTFYQKGLIAASLGFSRINTPELWKKSLDVLPEYMQESYAVSHKKE